VLFAQWLNCAGASQKNIGKGIYRPIKMHGIYLQNDESWWHDGIFFLQLTDFRSIMSEVSFGIRAIRYFLE